MGTMAEAKDVYEIRLSDYSRLRDTEDGTRLAISDVLPGTARCVFPTLIQNNIERLVESVNKEQAVRNSQGIIARTLKPSNSRAKQFPFIGNPKLKGHHMSLIVDFDYTNVAIRLEPLTRYITVQSTNLFNFLKPHPLNSGAVDMLLDKVRDYEPMMEDELRQFVVKIQQQSCKAHNQSLESTRLRIVLAGVTNLQCFNKTYYSPLYKEVRDPAFLIPSININNEWQDLSDYKDLVPTGSQPKRLFTVSNLFWPPCIFLDIENGGEAFLKQAEQEAQKLANDDWLYRATDGLVFTPSPKSDLRNDERFWFRVSGAKPVPPSWANSDPTPRLNRLAAEASRQDRLREEAQAFAEKICTEETFERAWNMVTENMRYDEIFPRHMIRHYMAAVWQIEHIIADEEEWAAVDRSKVQPKIDRMARTWIMAKLETQDTVEPLNHAEDWVHVENENTALDLTSALQKCLLDTTSSINDDSGVIIYEMSNTEQRTTFLTLPRELRDMIYSFAFSSTIVNIADPSSHSTRNTGILATCHQTRAEALKSYYKNTCFHAPTGTLIFPWGRKIPNEFCKSLREVQRASLDYDARWRHRGDFIRMFVEALESRDPRIPWRKVLRVKCRIAPEAPAEWWSLEGWEEAGGCR